MFKQIAHWYSAWEDESLRMLEDPSRAEESTTPFRRAIACKLQQMSPIERQQLHAFSLRYRGWRWYAAMAKCIALFCVAGLVWYWFRPAKGLLPAIVLANTLGLVGMMVIFAAWFNYRRMQGKRIRILLLVTVGAGVGSAMGMAQAAWMKGQSMAEALDKMFPAVFYIGLGACVFLAVPMAIVAAMRNQQHEMIAARLAAEAEHERLARELSEARLRMLSAQIEPHFLFNTLGAVQQLAEDGAPRAAALTASLIAFLRASLAEMRSEKARLVADFALVDAYLAVMQTRLGPRLRYQLDLPASLGQHELPSMMLLTLVENAIKHGIEPALRGGVIRVSASVQGAQLRVQVADSGAGMSDIPGAGEGLDNIRKRLQLTYGAAASLLLEEGDEAGFVASILIPLDLKVAP